MPIIFSGTALGGLSLSTIYYVRDISVEQPANLSQFYTTFTVSSTVGGAELSLSSSTGTMKAAGSKTTILEITGQDFTLGGSGLANLNLTTARTQPKQRYAVDTANNTVVDNIIVTVAGTVVTQSGNWDFDAGDRWEYSTSSSVDTGCLLYTSDAADE